MYYKNDHGAPEPKTKIADSACFSEDGKRSVAAILKDLTGLVFTPSHKHDHLTSVDRIGARLSNGLITFDPRCENTIRQIKELRYKREPGISKKEDIVDIEDDSFDVLAYIDAEINPSVKRSDKRQTLVQQLDAKARMRMIGEAYRTKNPAIDDLEAAWQSG